MRALKAVSVLAALAHEHRLSIFRMLVEAGPEGMPAGDIASRLKVQPSSATFHLHALRRASLITQQRKSRQIIYSADFGMMSRLVGYLTENCCAGSASASKVGCGAPEVSTNSSKNRRTG